MVALEFRGTYPVLCDVEEARSLQYRCECVESFLIDQGLSLTYSFSSQFFANILAIRFGFIGSEILRRTEIVHSRRCAT